MKLSSEEVGLIETVRAYPTSKLTVIVHNGKPRKVTVEIITDLVAKAAAAAGVPRGTPEEFHTREKI